MADAAPGDALPNDRTTITLIRHGESKVTVERIIGGKRTCRGLSPLGREQSERLRERLLRTDEGVGEVLIASDFARAVETAEILRPAFGGPAPSTPLEQWEDLGEHDPGPEIDGMSFAEYVDRFGTPEWTGDPDVEIFPGGETTRQFHQRVERGLATLRVRFARRHVAVVCHGGVVDAAFRILLDLRRTAGFELQTLNTALTTFIGPVGDDADSAAVWRLERYNDAAHLAGLPDATPRRR